MRVVFTKTTERKMRLVRWLLLGSWLGGVVGLLVSPDGPWLKLWWLAVIPATILCLVVLGHDTWRRICPLSALNQLPRLLGIGRSTRVDPDAWLARHALPLQFGLLTAAVILRLTLLNQSSFALGIFLLAVMGLALAVGFLFGGKTWCHYVCPMAPVQMVYSGPHGLLTTPAALGGSGPGLSQSMCRNGRDEPTCVACNTACPDIDLEKNYWEQLATAERRAVVYGYLGLVIGYVVHVRLGLDSQWAAPVVIGAISNAALAGWGVERVLRAQEATRHHLLTLTTLSAFSILIGGGLLPSLPEVFRLPLAAAAAAAIATWSWNVWRRSRQAWQREALASVLRRRLGELPLDLAPHLGGRTLDQLSADEVGVLAAVLPGLNRDLRQHLYQGVLSDAAAAGQLGSRDAEDMLAHLRGQLSIADDQHQLMVSALPTAGSIPRRESYRQAVERLVLDGLADGEDLAAVIVRQQEPLSQLRAAYSISDDEQEQVIFALTHGDGLIGRAGTILVGELERVCAERAALTSNSADGFLREHLEQRGAALAKQLAGVREALGETAAGTALSLAVVKAAIDPALVAGASGKIIAPPLAEVRARLALDADPLVAEVARQPPRPAITLRLALSGIDVPCAETTARIGRNPRSTVVVTHQQASRDHALVGLDDHGAWLEDLGSANGTLIDGRLVRGERVRLPPAASIRIGTDGPFLAVGARESIPDDRVALFLALRASAVGSLPREILWELAESSRLRQVEAGQPLLRAGMTVDSLLVLVCGSATANSGSAGQISSGETIGELALISDRQTTTTVTALTHCAVCAIPGARAASLLTRHPGVALALLALAGRRLSDAPLPVPDDVEKTILC